MKAKLLLVIPLVTTLFSACGGDHGVHNGKDTSENSYQVPKDTSRPDASGADSASIDNSGSGGTKIPKADTSKRK